VMTVLATATPVAEARGAGDHLRNKRGGVAEHL